jgi:hypothetical protein
LSPYNDAYAGHEYRPPAFYADMTYRKSRAPVTP